MRIVSFSCRDRAVWGMRMGVRSSRWRSGAMIVVLIGIAMLSNPVGMGSASAQAACDCSRIVGQCQATFTLSNVRNDPARRSSAAEVQFRSNAPRCSKIEFYLENTPHITNTGNGQIARESVFGTAAISASAITIENCRICASGGSGNQSANPAVTSEASRLLSGGAGAGFDRGAIDQQLQSLVEQDAQSQRDSALGMGTLGILAPTNRPATRPQPRPTGQRQCPPGFGMSWDGRCYDCRRSTSATVC